MSNRAKRRPMPVDQSIHWKPLRDSHYIVASLQVADGGRRQIFVEQHILPRVQAEARTARGRPAFGLLMGHFFECSMTGTDYMVIDHVVEQHGGTGDHSALAEDDIAASIGQVVGALSDRNRQQLLGWYRVAASVEAKPSPTTASLHASYFPQPWQTLLVLAPDTHSGGGAFFLRDGTNGRWFYAPFYELAPKAPAPNQPIATYVSWPQYMTAESVTPVHVEPTPAPLPSPTQPPRPVLDDRVQLASLGDDGWANVDQDLQVGDDTIQFRPPRDDAIEPPGDATAEDNEATPAGLTSPPAQPGLTGKRAGGDAKGATSRWFLARLGDREVERPAAVERVEKRAAPPRIRRVSDDDDTSASDDSARFIELARSEGFFVATRFDAAGESGAADALWVLNEPYSGLLLTVVTSGAEVVDASLHYNLHTDDAGLLRVPFPEHRDPDSKTIYVRETCVEGLRERCRRLRATNALVRDWKVAPSLSFLTPGEWQSPSLLNIDAAQAVATVTELNKSRVAELPEAVRDQFRLTRERSDIQRPA